MHAVSNWIRIFFIGTLFVGSGCTRTPNASLLKKGSVQSTIQKGAAPAASARTASGFDVEYVYDALGWSIPDNDNSGVSMDIDVTEDVIIQDLAVEVHIDHPYVGDLQLSLVGPDGTTVVLQDRSGGSADNLYQTYGAGGLTVAALAQFYSSYSTHGIWHLVVKDLGASDTGTLNYVRLSFDEVPAGPPDPSQFTAVANSVDTLRLTWLSGGGSTSGFYVAFQTGSIAPADCFSGTNYDLGNVMQSTLNGFASNTRYALRLCAYDSAGNTSDGVTTSVYTNASAPPEPSNFVATANSSSSIHLNWISGGGSTTGFRLAYRAGSTPPDSCFQNANSDLFFRTSYDVNGLYSNTLYSFRLCSYDNTGLISDGVTTLEFTDPRAAAPDPVNFTAQAVSASSIHLSWQSGGVETSGYQLTYRTGNVPSVDCVTGSVIPLGLVNQYDLSGLTAQTSYSFRLCSLNSENTLSAGVTATRSTLPLPPPEPSNLVAQALSPSSILLNWNSGGGSSATFVVAYSLGNIAPANCSSGIHVGPALSYTASALTAASNYSFRVCAETANGTLSSGVTGSARTPQLPPPAPTNLVVSSTSPGALVISWSSGGGSSEHYLLAVSAGSSAPADCSSGSLYFTDQTNFNLGGLSEYAEYSVRVCAQNSNTPRDTSSGIVATGRTLESASPNPVNLTATPAGPTQVNLNWSNGGATTSGFLVSFALGNVPPQNCDLGTNVGALTSYSVTGLQSASNYSFRVCSQTVHGTKSTGANASSHTPQIPPPAPINLIASVLSSSELAFSWSSGGGSSDHYVIAVSSGAVAPANCNSGAVYNTDLTHFNLTGLNELSDYSVRVCAQNSNTPRETSVGVVGTGHTAEAPPPDPSSLSTLATSQSQVRLNWVSSGGRTASFVVAFSSGTTAPGNCNSGLNVGGATSFTVNNLQMGSTYAFRVCAQSAHNIVSGGIVAVGSTDGNYTLGSLRGVAHAVITGTDAGPEGNVRVVDAATGALKFQVSPFPGFTGGVRVAIADVNRDGVPDVITAAGPGGGPVVRVYSGADGTVIYNFLAYSADFRNGLYIASADVDGDGYADLITGPDVGGGPQVRVFSGANGTPIRDFFAFDSSFRGGLRIAAADVDGDGYGDIIVTPGTGGGPVVEVFSGRDNTRIQNFYAFDPNFRLGIFVGAGDVDGDGYADIITGVGNGGGPHTQVFSGRTNQVIGSFFAYDPNFRGGVRVAAANLSGTGRADVITAAGPGGGPHIRSFSGLDLGRTILSFFAEAASFSNGVFVGGY